MMFAVIDERTNAELGFAYRLVDAIGIKEFFERKGYKNVKILRKN